MKSTGAWLVSGVVRVMVLAMWVAGAGLALEAAEKKKAADKKPEATGSLLYANAVGEKGWSFLVLNGEDLLPEGIAPGYRSSWVRFPVGTLAIELEHQPLGLVSLEAELQPEGLHAFVTYSDLADQERVGRPQRPVLAVKELRCDLIVPADKRSMTNVVLLNLTSHEQLKVQVNEETVDLPRLQEVLVTPGKRGSLIELTVLKAEAEEKGEEAGQSVAGDQAGAAEPNHFQRINVEDAGTRYVIYFAGVQNEIQSLLFDDVGMFASEKEGGE